MGRLKPAKGTTEDLEWEKWSGVKRNIWLWSRVNEHLYKFATKQHGCIVLYYETLRDSPADFWEKCLRGLNLLSSTNMDICLTCTESKVNARQSYDIGGPGMSRKCMSIWHYHWREKYMSDQLKAKIISIVELALNKSAESPEERVTLTAGDSMETVAAWDSLNFMAVFHAINEAFNISPDFDDAINYISISALHDYLRDEIK